MSEFVTGYDKNEKLYQNSLKTIKNIKFTFREIDIIACIIHNRGDKKIAFFCDISPRTVSAHIYNIMNKIGCNSKDQIIDFIETSSCLILLREYYLHIMMKSIFEKYLSKISRINKNQLNVFSFRDDVANISDSVYGAIKKHFSKANIILSVGDSHDLSNGITIELKNIREDSYYKDMLKILSQILNSPLVDEMIKSFDESYIQVQDMYSGKQIIETDYSKTHLVDYLFSSKKLLLFIAFSIISLIGFFYIGSRNITNVNVENSEVLENFLAIIKDHEFSANNTDKDISSNNQSMIKKVEKLLGYANTKEVQNYLDKAEMPSETLTSYIYNLQGLASYYMYNRHDAIKAQEILSQAKKIAENYVNIRNNTKCDFDKITPEEIISELQIIKHLPQIYTRVLYSIARTYIYTSEKKKGEKYFELAKQLGLSLNLFEGYLSDTSGILIIKKEEAEYYAKNGETKLAKQELLNVIEQYDTIKNDRNSYILDYNPNSPEQRTIRPSEQPFNLLVCDCNILSIYNILIEISTSNLEINYYIKKIKLLLDGEKESRNIMTLVNKVPLKRTADLYIDLGEIFLTLWAKKYKALEIQNFVEKLLSIRAKDHLEMAEVLFDKAKSISRNVDFTKADAYDGLVRVYEAKLAQTNYYGDPLFKNKEELLKEIEKYKNKRDLINQTLGRNNL